MDQQSDAWRRFFGSIVWIQLPNGPFMDGWSADLALSHDKRAEQVSMVSFGTNDWNSTLSFKDLDTLVYSMSFIKAPPGTNATEHFPNLTLEATECAHYYCVNELSSGAINGTLQEEVREVSRRQTESSWQPLNRSALPDYWPTSLMQSIDFPRTDLELAGSFNISQDSINGIGSYFAELTQETFKHRNVTFGGVNGYYSSSLSGDSWQCGPDSIKPLYDSPDLNATFTQLAKTMSNNIRSNADNGTVVYGKTGITVYQVHWPRIALPIFDACVFLAITIFKSRQQQVAGWKSSSLAVLACGASVDDALGGANSLSEMEAVAKQRAMSLLDVGKGEAGKTVLGEMRVVVGIDAD